MRKLIIKILNETGMTQTELGNHIGVVQSVIALILSCRRHSSLYTLMKLINLAKLLGIPVTIDDIYVNPKDIEKEQKQREKGRKKK
jgi:DNA-binding XRE family transcriptional regulator